MTLSLRPLAAVLLAAAAALTGCAELQDVRDPQVSDLVLDRATMGEVNRISVPMPLVEPTPPPKRAEASGLWSSDTTSFFRDRRAQNVGDLVTVLIDINDRAQLQNATNRSREGKQELADPDFLNLDLSTDSGKAIALESSSERSGTGSIRRNESIQLRVAALIIDELPNGNFVIAGRQEVKVNAELRELRIAGIIRESDILVNNTISYDKIAEARISYGGRGQISVVQTARPGQDILEILLPY